ncbi:hypothetical protein SNOG_00415 [Parastagonospora nodorum SN15]|uniref:Uncharacterized protein n=1 Tax=Phaeosphaeria nodorum (strain SN15 / ATCC MYA-4574 / FGSC 10173) TaxID=321614 RepID=Q0V6E9_PHANO|nr:hypothetical protein SNOG_00415 [Parastagonospora nodorum SN15]EAT91910.1 hypothetical protein SNOG_00415 [Parastagonospora nodorum SN15]
MTAFSPHQPSAPFIESETHVEAVKYKKADALSSSSPAKKHKVLVPSDNYFRH